ncbi:MAG: heme-binding protein [Gemmatimonadales bacterium]
MKRLLFLAAAMIVLAPVAARAQLADAKILTLQAAKTILAAAEAEARKNGWKVSIAVVDSHGELIAFERMDEAALTTVAIAQGKALTAARFKRPSKAIDSSVTAGRVQMMAFPGVMPVEGGVPIVVNEKYIGAVGTSGATSAQDAQVSRAGVDALKP